MSALSCPSSRRESRNLLAFDRFSQFVLYNYCNVVKIKDV